MLILFCLKVKLSPSFTIWSDHQSQKPGQDRILAGYQMFAENLIYFSSLLLITKFCFEMQWDTFSDFRYSPIANLLCTVFFIPGIYPFQKINGKLLHFSLFRGDGECSALRQWKIPQSCEVKQWKRRLTHHITLTEDRSMKRTNHIQSRQAQTITSRLTWPETTNNIAK